MITDEQIVESYRKHRRLFDVGKELSMPWQTVYVRLKNAGEPVCGDKSRYGSKLDRFAAKAERKFLDLVPFAEYMNVRKFQAEVDFIVNGKKVDVKASKEKKSNRRFESTRYSFSLKKQLESADFYVLFGFAPDGETMKNCFLIPRDMVNEIQTISIQCQGKSKWFDFEVAPESLSEFFSSFK